LDQVLPVFCLIVGGMLPLMGMFFLVNRGMRQLRVAHAYGDVARRLGLPVDTRGVSLQGHLDDRRIWIGEVMVGHGPKRRLVTWGVVDMDRALGLGLVIRRRGLSQRLFRRRRGPEIALGGDLDRRVEIQGDDPGRVRALLTPKVRLAIESLMSRWPDVVVTDQSVRVHLPRPESSGARLQGLVNAMIGLCDEIEAARHAIAPPERLLSLLPELEAMGTRLGLEYDPWLPGLDGDLDGQRLSITPRRDGAGYSFDIRVYFPSPVDTGFRLSAQVAPDGYWSVGQDIQVGDEVFDNAFVIKGYDPLKVAERLTPEVRAALLDIRSNHDIEIDDRCLHIRRVKLDIATVDDVAVKASRATAALRSPLPTP